jgi:hypothetical protein
LGLSSDRQRDPLCGLYIVELDKQIVGGFGLKQRLFWEEGIDNFRPYDGTPLLGYFLYGAVIRSDLRGKGLFIQMNMTVFHMLRRSEVYHITDRAHPRGNHYFTEEVGRNGHYRAYRAWILPAKLPLKIDKSHAAWLRFKANMNKRLGLRSNSLCAARDELTKSQYDRACTNVYPLDGSSAQA